MKIKLSCAVIAVTMLSGCVSMLTDDPMMIAAYTIPDTVEVDDEVTEAKLAWIGKDLLEPNARREAAKLLAEQDLPEEWDETQYSTLASMATDMFVGEVGSSLGGAVGGAVLVLGMLSGDGSSNNASGLFLPAQFGDIAIDSADLAHDVAIDMVHENIVDAAMTLGYQAICEYGCNSGNRVYRLDIVSNTDRQYVYQPDTLTVSMNVSEFVEAGKEAVLDSIATGEPIKWRSADPHGAMVLLGASPSYDESGKLSLTDIESTTSPFKIASGDLTISRTPFGRDFTRAMFDNPYHYQGSNNLSYFAYSGAVYKLYSNSSINAFDDKIVK
ncbi:MAG: hypothetical protein CBC02_000155 [Flavobacteriaceae bacterium TMED42]|nr:MAG: hypothetical protein CBC02_000155 [Flavobacteriaceae bacterium TMED42]